MSMYGDGVKQQLWEGVQFAQGTDYPTVEKQSWMDIVKMLAEIIADIMMFELGVSDD